MAEPCFDKNIKGSKPERLNRIDEISRTRIQMRFLGFLNYRQNWDEKIRVRSPNKKLK